VQFERRTIVTLVKNMDLNISEKTAEYFTKSIVIFAHAEDSRVSKAMSGVSLCDSVSVSVTVCLCLSAR